MTHEEKPAAAANSYCDRTTRAADLGIESRWWFLPVAFVGRIVIGGIVLAVLSLLSCA